MNLGHVRSFLNGPIDGVLGAGSRGAIRSFQRAENLPVTGLIDPSLLKALKLPPIPRMA
jgi:peptidoglycan hydrolase-like protein with peptidoglycan-binding domain